MRLSDGGRQEATSDHPMTPSALTHAIATAGGLVAVGDVAGIARVGPETVNQWTRRYPDFRALGHRTSGGWVWVRADAEAWLRETGRLRSP